MAIARPNAGRVPAPDTPSTPTAFADWYREREEWFRRAARYRWRGLHAARLLWPTPDDLCHDLYIAFAEDVRNGHRPLRELVALDENAAFIVIWHVCDRLRRDRCQDLFDRPGRLTRVAEWGDVKLVSTPAADHGRLDQLRAALEHLPEEHVRLVRLALQHDDKEKVADELGCSLATVYRRLADARAALQPLLSRAAESG